ncbi:MAG: PE domain-containing protein [Actinomycetota bacterium]|nr:PE domain-containing protein [Actinomycetota bacterium]
MSSENQWWSGAASDTGNVLEGTALGALLGGNSAAVGFSIDYERVPQAIADLEHAAKFISNQADVAHSLANIPAPGADGVSVNAAAQIGRWASDTGTNNLEATLRLGAKQLEGLAQKLRKELKTYLQVEELNIPQASPGLPL